MGQVQNAKKGADYEGPPITSGCESLVIGGSGSPPNFVSSSQPLTWELEQRIFYLRTIRGNMMKFDYKPSIDLLTLYETRAEFGRISRSTFYRRRRDGSIRLTPVLRIGDTGRKLFFRKTEVLGELERLIKLEEQRQQQSKIRPRK